MPSTAFATGGMWSGGKAPRARHGDQRAAFGAHRQVDQPASSTSARWIDGSASAGVCSSRPNQNALADPSLRTFGKAKPPLCSRGHGSRNSRVTRSCTPSRMARTAESIFSSAVRSSSSPTMTAAPELPRDLPPAWTLTRSPSALTVTGGGTTRARRAATAAASLRDDAAICDTLVEPPSQTFRVSSAVPIAGRRSPAGLAQPHKHECLLRAISVGSRSSSAAEHGDDENPDGVKPTERESPRPAPLDVAYQACGIHLEIGPAKTPFAWIDRQLILEVATSTVS